MVSMLALAAAVGCGRADRAKPDLSAFHGEFLKALSNYRYGIFEAYLVDPETRVLPDTESNLWAALHAKLPSLLRETYDDLRSANERPSPVAPAGRGRMAVYVLSKQEIADLQAAKQERRWVDAEAALRARYPASVHIGLSAPGFSRDHTQALMCYQDDLDQTAARRKYCLMAWREGRWHIDLELLVLD